MDVFFLASLCLISRNISSLLLVTNDSLRFIDDVSLLISMFINLYYIFLISLPKIPKGPKSSTFDAAKLYRESESYLVHT